MLQLGGGFDLAEEALDADALGQLAVHDLDGDIAVVTHVVGEIDVRHSARADEPLDLVAVGHRDLSRSNASMDRVEAKCQQRFASTCAANGSAGW
jgi:hypothetical protein